MESLPGAKPVSASRVTMTELVIPEDTNPRGNIFGGRVMALINKAAAIVGMRHCRTQVVTASVDSLTFLSPILLGSIVILEGRIHNVFRSSMEVRVRVESEDALTLGEEAHHHRLRHPGLGRLRRERDPGPSPAPRDRGGPLPGPGGIQAPRLPAPEPGDLPGPLIPPGPPLTRRGSRSARGGTPPPPRSEDPASR